jgi:Tol biopolymer transport system component
MKKLCLLMMFLLLNFPVNAQDADMLLLFTRRDETSEVSKLYVLNANTGEERLITDSVEDAGWSPDGRVWVVDTVNEARRLRLFDVESGEESTFDENLYPDSCFPSLLWSPDGEQLAYFTGNENELVLKLLNLADGTHYQMPVTRYELPEWSPDGNYILVNEQILSSPFRLLAADDGSELLDNIEDAVFSPDSRYLAYADEGQAVWLYQLATGETSALEVPERRPVWSPGGRYLILDVYPYAESLDYYDVESGSLSTIDVGYPIDFAAWAADESSILLYADFVDYTGDERPTTVLRYDLESGESETILADTGWSGGVYQNGDWTVIRYSSIPLEERYSPTTHVLIYNSEERLEIELLVGVGRWLFRSSIMNLGEGFLIGAEDGLYRFEVESASLETIYSGMTGYPFRSADNAYLAYLVFTDADVQPLLNIWNVERETLSVVLPEEGRISIIGWRDSPVQDSLLYCGIG